MDSHHTSLAPTRQAAALKLAKLPDPLALCNLGIPVHTIALLRALADQPRKVFTRQELTREVWRCGA